MPNVNLRTNLFLFSLFIIPAFTYADEGFKPASLLGQPCNEKNLRQYFKNEDPKFQQRDLSAALRALKVFDRHKWKPMGYHLSEEEKYSTSSILQTDLPESLRIALGFHEKTVEDSGALPVFRAGGWGEILCFDRTVIGFSKFGQGDETGSFGTVLKEKYGNPKVVGTFSGPTTKSLSGPYVRKLDVTQYTQPWGIVLLVKDVCNYTNPSDSPGGGPYIETNVYYVNASKIAEINRTIEKQNTEPNQKLLDEINQENRKRDQSLRKSL